MSVGFNIYGPDVIAHIGPYIDIVRRILITLREQPCYHIEEHCGSAEVFKSYRSKCLISHWRKFLFACEGLVAVFCATIEDHMAIAIEEHMPSCGLPHFRIGSGIRCTLKVFINYL